MFKRKTRVAYKIRESNKVKIGYLVRDKYFSGGYKVVNEIEHSSISVDMIAVINRI